jgi:hypothetical protein
MVLDGMGAWGLGFWIQGIVNSTNSQRIILSDFSVNFHFNNGANMPRKAKTKIKPSKRIAALYCRVSTYDQAGLTDHYCHSTGSVNKR